ncbi:MAG: hypothetical protein QOG63_263 [Thermoleophilaceae bacterium]|jgi:hypothetical protein|nr:hypothetical protein [Thermoleophilaceae bacterium]
MRKRDPRRLLSSYRESRARVEILGKPENSSAPDGSVTTKQVADVTLPESELDRIWNAEYLERLARTYWRFLTRVSLGLIRVHYTPDRREVVLVTRPFRLLTFNAPEYDTEPTRGTVTWSIREGLLVAPHGRNKGYLRISVERREDWSDGPGGLQVARVTSEVGNFYPTIAGWGWFAKIGQFIYRITQLFIHAVVTDAFFRSLARLDLAPSVVGAMRQQAEELRAEGDEEGAREADAIADVEVERREAAAG